MSTGINNPFYGPLARARNLLAASATFQALVDADDAAEALASIYCPSLPGGAAAISAARPFALIDHGEERTHHGGWGAQADNGTILLLLEAEVPAEHAGETAAKHAAAHKWFCEILGDILAEMLAGATTVADALAMTGWSPIDGPARPEVDHRKAAGDFYQVIVELSWGGAE